MRGRAFTLIEVIAVVAVLGVIASATAWSIADRVAASSREQVMGRLTFADRTARLAAQRTGRAVALRFNLAAQTITRRVAESSRHSDESHTQRVKAPFRIERIVTPAARASPRSNRRRARASTHSSGVVDIEYSTEGRSDTFALELTSPQGSRWLVFAGLTGQPTWMQDEEEVYNLFALLSSDRADAG